MWWGCTLLTMEKYGLIETKIGSEKSIEEAEKHLLELKKLISENDKLRKTWFSNDYYKHQNGLYNRK